MSKLSFEFPDGSVKQFDDGVTSEDIAKSIAVSLGKKAVAAKLDGKLVNNDEPLHKGGKIEIITSDSKDGLSVLRATAAQILKMAIAKEFNNIHFGESDADEDGFFVDTDKPDTQISVDQLEGLSQSMHKIIKKDLPIKVVFLSADEAAKVAGDDPYQKNWLRKMKLTARLSSLKLTTSSQSQKVPYYHQPVKLRSSNYFQLPVHTGRVSHPIQCCKEFMQQHLTSKRIGCRP